MPSEEAFWCSWSRSFPRTRQTAQVDCSVYLRQVEKVSKLWFHSFSRLCECPSHDSLEYNVCTCESITWIKVPRVLSNTPCGLYLDGNMVVTERSNGLYAFWSPKILYNSLWRKKLAKTCSFTTIALGDLFFLQPSFAWPIELPGSVPTSYHELAQMDRMRQRLWWETKSSHPKPSESFKYS